MTQRETAGFALESFLIDNRRRFVYAAGTALEQSRRGRRSCSRNSPGTEPARASFTQPEQPWNKAGAGFRKKLMEQLGQCVKFQNPKNTQRETAGTAPEQSRRRVPEKADGAAGAVRKIQKMEKYAAGNRRNRPGTAPARFALFGSSVHQSDAARAGGGTTAGVVHRTDGAGADSFTQREPPWNSPGAIRSIWFIGSSVPAGAGSGKS
ncbi:MAG: hypothetical protein IJH67_06080 [Thermoguttaceae bacterium]|nr:hypothetical protein [Thermoguttaceae bacterium]